MEKVCPRSVIASNFLWLYKMEMIFCSTFCQTIPAGFYSNSDPPTFWKKKLWQHMVLLEKYSQDSKRKKTWHVKNSWKNGNVEKWRLYRAGKRRFSKVHASCLQTLMLLGLRKIIFSMLLHKSNHFVKTMER